MLNFIWSGFFLAAFAAALYQSLGLDNAAIWTELVNSTFASAKSAFQICLNLTGMLCLWLGLLKIAERSYRLAGQSAGAVVSANSSRCSV